MNLAITHVLRVAVESKEKHLLSQKFERFWDLDTIGIVEKEKSVYKIFLDNISFHDNRYEVHLPFKEDHSMIEDNYELCKKHLSQLKKQLDNKPELKREYNNIIESQKISHIIERVESSGEIGEVTYLPHRAIVRENKSTTKVRIIEKAYLQISVVPGQGIIYDSYGLMMYIRTILKLLSIDLHVLFSVRFHRSFY